MLASLHLLARLSSLQYNPLNPRPSSIVLHEFSTAYCWRVLLVCHITPRLRAVQGAQLPYSIAAPLSSARSPPPWERTWAPRAHAWMRAAACSSARTWLGLG